MLFKVQFSARKLIVTIGDFTYAHEFLTDAVSVKLLNQNKDLKWNKVNAWFHLTMIFSSLNNNNDIFKYTLS